VPLYVKEVLTMRQENVKNQNNRRNMFSSGKSVAAAANRPNPFARGGAVQAECSSCPCRAPESSAWFQPLHTYRVISWFQSSLF
jgi:hypothetical protein